MTLTFSQTKMSFDSQHIIICSKLIYCSKDHHFSTRKQISGSTYNVKLSIMLQCSRIIQEVHYMFVLIYFQDLFLQELNKITSCTINSYRNVIRKHLT